MTSPQFLPASFHFRDAQLAGAIRRFHSAGGPRPRGPERMQHGGELIPVIPAVLALLSAPEGRFAEHPKSIQNFCEGLPSLDLPPTPASEGEDQDRCCVTALHASQCGRGRVAGVLQGVGEVRIV